MEARYRVGLAVSGGADSTALLVLMAELRASHGFDAVVLHVDHGLRKESGEDAEFVRRLARRFDLPFHAFATKVVRRKGESVEMAARRVRLGFFADAMKRYRLDCIATAHHMDDVAETFLMRLKRSSGAAGLAGLKPVSFVDGIVFIRPLLNVRGGELREFLRSRGIGWREDATNADTTILRNKVRHVILPFLARELDPKIVEHICRSAGYLRSGLRAEEKMKAKVDDVANAEMSPTDKSNTPPALKVERSVGYERTPVAIGRMPATCWMDAAAVCGRTLIVRGWQGGDRMRPCGFPHRRKLQDIFVTAKVPPAVRRSLPVVVDAETGEVLWIPGYRVSEAVKVPSATAPSLKFTLSQGRRQGNDVQTEKRNKAKEQK